MRDLDVFPLPKGTYYRTSGYGYRRHPVTGAATSFHRGVDYAAPTGTPLLAPFDGFVTTGNEPGGAGLWINLANGSDLFKSFHHSAYKVRSGFVGAGTHIADIGTTGSSTGPHAHLELWENGRNIDPTPYLNAAEHKMNAPVPAPVQEEEDVKFILRDKNMGAWLCWGLFRRFIATQAEYDQLVFLGVEYKGMNHDFVMNHFTEIPRDRIA